MLKGQDSLEQKTLRLTLSYASHMIRFDPQRARIMNILGICNANNSGAALIVDGKVIAAANEERFIRVKQTRKFPENAIRYVLSVGNLTLDDVDYIGCGAWAGIDSVETLPVLLREFADKVKQGSWKLTGHSIGSILLLNLTV